MGELRQYAKEPVKPAEVAAEQRIKVYVSYVEKPTLRMMQILQTARLFSSNTCFLFWLTSVKTRVAAIKAEEIAVAVVLEKVRWSFSGRPKAQSFLKRRRGVDKILSLLGHSSSKKQFFHSEQ